jgi:hypothetical protein
MSVNLLILFIFAIFIIIAIIIDKKPKRIMREGKLLKSEIVCRDGEKFYVEKVIFKDWHVSIHSYYLISDRLTEGHTIVEQQWNYDDFCNITIRLEDCTYALIRQVDIIALVRSFRSIPIDEFDRIARPLIM